MLLNLHMDVVGDASNWPAVIAKVPVTNPDILLVDWELLPADPTAHLSALRQSCSNPFFIVLISYLEARQQAAISTGADAFISKFEAPNRLADRLQVIAESLDV
jgi:DNA-binding NarL/FixJ family response regulator